MKATCVKDDLFKVNEPYRYVKYLGAGIGTFLQDHLILGNYYQVLGETFNNGFHCYKVIVPGRKPKEVDVPQAWFGHPKNVQLFENSIDYVEL